MQHYYSIEVRPARLVRVALATAGTPLEDAMTAVGSIVVSGKPGGLEMPLTDAMTPAMVGYRIGRALEILEIRGGNPSLGPVYGGLEPGTSDDAGQFWPKAAEDLGRVPGFSGFRPEHAPAPRGRSLRGLCRRLLRMK